MNFDVATFTDSQSIGVGVVARSPNGAFLPSLCKKIEVSIDPSAEEAIAVLVAVDFICGLPFHMLFSKGMH